MIKNYLLLLLLCLTVMDSNAQCTSSSCTFVSSAQATGNSSGVTIAAPAGVLPGDVMIAAIHAGWCSSGSSLTPPSGWTLINESSNTGSGCGSGNTSIQLATFYKVAGGTEPANYTFTGSTSQFYVGGIVAYTGVNSLSPINASSNSGNQEDCSSIGAPGVTTTAPCTRLVNVFICSVNFSATNIIPQASLTERLDVSTTGNHPWGNENLEISDEVFTTAGATGARMASLTGCSGLGWVTAGQMIALECATATSMNDDLLSNSYTVSPNPSSGVFDITAGNKKAMAYKIEVFDALGRNVRSMDINTERTTIDLSSEPKGIYVLKLISEMGTLVTKVVVQ